MDCTECPARGTICKEEQNGACETFHDKLKEMKKREIQNLVSELSVFVTF